MRLVLMGDGAWAARSLERLREDGHAIAAAVLRVRPTSGSFADTCRRLAIPLLQPPRVNDPDVVATLAGLEPELCVSISYDQILGERMRTVAPRGAVNFHAGKLPHYRGRNVVNWAIVNGETEIGLTAHRIDAGIDTGDILRQTTLPIFWEDTYAEVLDRLIDAFPAFVSDTLRDMTTGQVSVTPQTHLPGSYYRRRGPEDEWLDWHDTSIRLYNKIRGITRPGPGARARLDGRTVRVWRARYSAQWSVHAGTPGEVVERRPDGVLVQTGDSTLLLTDVHADNERLETHA